MDRWRDNIMIIHTRTLGVENSSLNSSFVTYAVFYVSL